MMLKLIVGGEKFGANNHVYTITRVSFFSFDHDLRFPSLRYPSSFAFAVCIFTSQDNWFPSVEYGTPVKRKGGFRRDENRYSSYLLDRCLVHILYLVSLAACTREVWRLLRTSMMIIWKWQKVDGIEMLLFSFRFARRGFITTNLPTMAICGTLFCL